MFHKIKQKLVANTYDLDQVAPLPDVPFTTAQCIICARQKQTEQFAMVPGCGHQFCQNCIAEWVEASFQNQILHDSIQLTCPMSCGQTMTYDNLVSIIKQQQLRDRIETQYLKKYIHDSPDIVSCPSPQCNNAGIIVKKPCRSQLVCDSCGMQWKDPSQQTCWDKTKKLLAKRPTLRGSETFSNLSKVLFTIACPKCGVYIQKNGGCSHMQCSKCSHQFCWYCHGPHYDYQHARGNNCGVRNIQLFAAYAFIFLLIFLRMGQWFPFILTWPAFLLYYGAVLIATGFTCWFGVALPIIGFFSLLNDSRRYPKALCPLVCGSVIYIPVAYLFWGNFCYFQFGRDMWAMFQIGVTVLAIVLGCLALGFCCNKANTVRKRRIRL